MKNATLFLDTVHCIGRETRWYFMGCQCKQPLYISLGFMPLSRRTLIDTQRHSAVSLISGCLQPTQLSWLPVLSNVTPPSLHRKMATDNVLQPVLIGLCMLMSLSCIQTICTSLQTDNHTNTSSQNFFKLGALPDAQPTVYMCCLPGGWWAAG